MKECSFTEVLLSMQSFKKDSTNDTRTLAECSELEFTSPSTAAKVINMFMAFAAVPVVLLTRIEVATSVTGTKNKKQNYLKLKFISKFDFLDLQFLFIF